MKQLLLMTFLTATILVGGSSFCMAQENPEKQTITVQNNGMTVSFDMIYVQGGEFWMGATSEQSKAAYDDEMPSHRVAVSDYCIGKTEVTQALWFAVMGESPSQDEDKWSDDYGLGDDFPAYYISWNQISYFITKLNGLTGKKFRLPTEAEWEYAARGGAKSQKFKFSGSNTIKNVAWYVDNSQPVAHKVALKTPNELGLYDMSGNLFEWCSDWHDENYYKSSPVDNPKGPQDGYMKVLRGGSMNMSASGCRVSYRYSNDPGDVYYRNGLRLVCE